MIGEAGRFLTERVRVDTPVGRPPKEIVEALVRLVAPLGAYDRVAVGFPGVMREGRVLTAANLDNEGWKGFDLAGALRRPSASRCASPMTPTCRAWPSSRARASRWSSRSAPASAPGSTSTAGSRRTWSCRTIPSARARRNEDQLGNAARKRIGNPKWNRRVKKAIRNLRSLTSFDHLYIGGGNARKIDFALDADVTVVANDAGIRGGIALWKD